MTTASGGTGGTSRTGFSEQLQHLWRTRPTRLPGQSPVAGVASGFGRRYGVDPVLIRVAFVVSTIFGGAGIVLYLAAWLLLPPAGDAVSPAEGLLSRGHSSQSSTKTIVLIVALAIAVTTMGPVGVGLGGSGVISFALMVAGWWLLYMRQPEPPIDGSYPLTAEGGIAATGYPGASFPGGSPWSGSPYGPFTKLPDHYEPDPNVVAGGQVPATPAHASTAAEPIGATAATVPLRVDPHTPESLADEAGAAPPDSTSSAHEVTESGAAEVVPLEEASGRPDSSGAAADSGSSEHGAAAPDSPGDGNSSSDEPTAGKATSDETSADDRPTVALTRPLAVESGTATGSEGPSAEDESGPDDSPGSGGSAHPRPTPPPGPRPYGNRPIPDPAHVGPTPAGWDPLGVAPMAWDLPTPTQERPVAVVPVQRPRSRLTPVVIGLAVLAAAAAGAVAAAGADWMTPARIGAVALAVVGLGLIVGAFLRRGYGLMVVLAPLAGFVILASMVGPVEFDRGAMGDHVWTPATTADLASEYKITMGSGTLDLRQLPLTENRTVHVNVQMGDFRVLVPESMRLHATCNASMGDVSCPQGPTGPADGPILTLDVDVHAGNAEVKRG
ncbi:PspC domain-containing protein [Nocardia africana]|uniref:Phage shock protein C n=1 Tax=Nocardia africana TaxID=134964 RepID=A0A378WNB8_9NOCA|nr:PspC domain-containing protein [Nocardia africana]MCC3315755.1 PspC domain-containing protein [Nocardia africana]SUA41931.1 phage shock protein C [Nocardia africana]